VSAPVSKKNIAGHDIALPLMPFSTDMGGCDIRMVFEEPFDLPRVRLQTEHVDHILFNPGQCKVALIVNMFEVAALGRHLPAITFRIWLNSNGMSWKLV